MTSRGTESLAAVFDTLANEYRLRVLVSLYMADDGTYYWAEDLVRLSEDPDDVVPLLYHVHFPKLAEVGFIEWDREENRVARGPEFGVVDRLLDSLVVGDDEFESSLLAHEI